MFYVGFQKSTMCISMWRKTVKGSTETLDRLKGGLPKMHDQVGCGHALSHDSVVLEKFCSKLFHAPSNN